MKRGILVFLILLLVGLPAVAESREEILEQLGVFEIDELSLVERVELREPGYHSYYVYVDPGLILGGSENADDSWLTTEGVLSESWADMDGDGRDEYILVYSRRVEKSEDYFVHELRLRVYAGEGDALELKGDLPLHWNYQYMNEDTAVRILRRGGRAYVVNSNHGYWDGATNGMDVLVYAYDGEGCYAELAGNAINVGDYLLARQVEDPAILMQLTSNSYEAANMLQDTGADYEEYDTYDLELEHTFNRTGFDALAEAIAPYGLKTVVWEIDGSEPYYQIQGLRGGETIFRFVCEDYGFTIGVSGPAADAQAEGYALWTPVLSDDPWWEICPYSRKERLTKSDLEGCDKQILAYIRNEILARYGFAFTKAEYQEYFGGKEWYYPHEDFSYDDLTDMDWDNIALIQSME